MQLNLFEMGERLSVKLDLDSRKIEIFTQKVQEFFTILEDSIEKAEGVKTLEILSVLVSFKEYFSSESEWASLVHRLLEILCQDLSVPVFHPIFAYSGISQVAFTLHQLYEKIPNIERLLCKVNELLLANLHEYIKASNIPEFFTMNTFELLYGLSGPLRYVLDFNNDEKMYNTASKIVEVLVKRSHEKVINGHIVSGWHYYPSAIEAKFMTESAENGVVNYSLSHGMSGPLMTLSLAYSKGIRIDGLKEAIDSIFNEYFKAAYHVNGIIHWPGKITFEQYIGQEEINSVPRPMSWCYGSIGILRAIYLASIYMSNKENKIFAKNELIKIAKMDTTDYMLYLPINCHGFAGTSSIMTEMYTDTKNDVFLNMAMKHIIICIDYIINANFSYVETDPGKKVILYCYLEGYSGILQTIQSFIVNGDNAHKKRILVI